MLPELLLSLARVAWAQHAHVGSCKLGSEKNAGPGQTLAVAVTSKSWSPSALNRCEKFTPPLKKNQPKKPTSKLFLLDLHLSNITSPNPRIYVG